MATDLLEGMGVGAVVIDPSAPSTLYAAGHSRAGLRLVKSVDGGTTWRRLERGLPTKGSINVLAIDPQTPGTVYAGTFGDGVFKSVDGGESWASAGGRPSPTAVISALVVDPRTPSTLYAGGGGLFKSLDGGMRWEPAERGLTDSYIKALVIDPRTPTTLYAGTPAGVFKSVDGGANWIRTSAGLPNPEGYPASDPPEPHVVALAMAPGTPGTLYTGTRAGLFRSADGGATWTRVSGDLAASTIKLVAVTPSIPTTVYAVEFIGSLFRSADGGATWTRVEFGLRFNPGGSALAFDPRTPSTLYVGTYGGVLRIRSGEMRPSP